MIKINELLAFLGSVCRPGTKLRGFRGVTIHDTGNRSATANAKAHADLLRSGWRDKDVSWHYSVDDHSIYRSIPEHECVMSIEFPEKKSSGFPGFYQNPSREKSRLGLGCLTH